MEGFLVQQKVSKAINSSFFDYCEWGTEKEIRWTFIYFYHLAFIYIYIHMAIEYRWDIYTQNCHWFLKKRGDGDKSWVSSEKNMERIT